MSLPRREPLRSRAGPGGPAHGGSRDPGRRASPRADERDAVVPTSPPISFTGSFGLHVRTPAGSRTGPRPHHRGDGRRLSRRRHEVHDRRLAGRLGDDGPDGPLSSRWPGSAGVRSMAVSRSPSIGPTSMPGGRTERPPGHAPGRDRRGSLRRATGRATTPHAGEPERLLSSRARLRPGTRGRKGRLSPRGRDRVVVHVVEEPGRSPRLRAGRRGRRPHHQRGRNPRYGVSREARVTHRGVLWLLPQGGGDRRRGRSRRDRRDPHLAG